MRSPTRSTATSPSLRAAATAARPRTAASRSRASSTSAAAELTSITGYRDYKAGQGGDFDYGTVDILYRPDDGSSSRKFETFSQELRLQGQAFNNNLDWLVGAYYADEDLTLNDKLRFGDQYGRFAACRLVTGSTLAVGYNPANTGCLAGAVRTLINSARFIAWSGRTANPVDDRPA